MIDKNIRELVSVRLIRKDEREKVLDELDNWCKQQWFEVESDEGETFSVIHVGDILARIAELREGKSDKP